MPFLQRFAAESHGANWLFAPDSAYDSVTSSKKAAEKMYRAWILAGMMALAGAGGVLAEAPKPFPDFTFKRITPPKKGERPTLPQIEPQAAPAVEAAAPAPDPTTPADARYGWFWDVISTLPDRKFLTG